MKDDFFTEDEIKGLRAVTLEELKELHEDIINTLGSLNPGKNGKYELKRIGNLYHKVTGTAGIVGLMDISELASEGEELAGSNDLEAGEVISKLGELTRQFGEQLACFERGENCC